MRILVLSDSHSGLSFMRACIQAVKPDAMIHLGDYFEDGKDMAEEFPHIPMHQVPGNCDRYRMVAYHPEQICYLVGGVRLFMTHGHNEKVKMTLALLKKEARAFACSVVKLSRKLRNEKESILAAQFLRSGTSIGANLAEGRNSQTRGDRLAKHFRNYCKL